MSAGSFTLTITPNKGSNYNKLAYVDTSGYTKFITNSSTGATTQNIDPATLSLVAEDTGSVTMVLAYSGDITGDDNILAAWNALGKTKVSFTLASAAPGCLASGSNHAYAATAGDDLAFENIALADVAFTSGSYTVSTSVNFKYAIRGGSGVETGSTITISVKAGAALS